MDKLTIVFSGSLILGIISLILILLDKNLKFPKSKKKT